MKQATAKFSPRPRALALALGLTLLASCVSQEQYDEAVNLAHDYQAQLFGAQAEVTNLNSENSRLRREASLNISASDASYTENFVSEIEALRAQVRGLTDNPGGIQRFDLGARGYVFLIPDAIVFDLGSATLSKDGVDAIEDIASKINAAPHGRIWVRGHTDNTAIVREATKKRYPHGNLELSLDRADEVAWVLVNKGKVPADQVAVAGFGPHQPLVPNDTTENKRRNRRVEIYVAKAE